VLLLCTFTVVVIPRLAAHLDRSKSDQTATMVRINSAALVGSAMVGVTAAAGAGSKEDYASGKVHEHIMGIKMVCNHSVREAIVAEIMTDKLFRANGRRRWRLVS
jgi:aspartyl aminopeptidase